MTTLERINDDFLAAYKAKNMEKKNFLGTLKGAIQTEESKATTFRPGFVAEEVVISIVKRFEKSIRENISTGENTDTFNRELDYLKPYIPLPTSSDEINEFVKQAMEKYPEKVAEYKSGRVAVLGIFMGEVMKLSKGNANPKVVTELMKLALES